MGPPEKKWKIFERLVWLWCGLGWLWVGRISGVRPAGRPEVWVGAGLGWKVRQEVSQKYPKVGEEGRLTK